MEIIKECNINYQFNQTEPKLQSNASAKLEFNTNAKTADYFDYIYSYPPKIKLKWGKIDELKEDPLISSNYGTFEHSFPFIDFIEDWFFNDVPKKATSQNYPKSEYVDGFLDNINSSNFFFKKTKPIQSALNSIQVFVVLNGNGEIVLSKPSHILGSKSFNNYINGKIYDSCGAFDPLVEKKSALGLFFVNALDAENYLKEVARSDFEGTQTVGLSIHCIGLDSAYKITREHHPGIDFRFVPDFKEVKNLLKNDIGKSDMIIEDEQQQLRFRTRTANLFPYLKKLGSYLSPSSSFLQRNEYFKGVPIYIVQLTENPRSFWTERYFNVAGVLDNIHSRFIQSLDYTVGFGHNWIMQGSLMDAGNSDKSENYIFFDKEQAIKFSKTNGRKVARFSGGRTSSLENLVKKPKIFIYNLEDFLEDWEDKILNDSLEVEDANGTILNCKATHFVSPNLNSKHISDFSQDFETGTLKKLRQALDVKFRIFKHATGIFFSIN